MEPRCPECNCVVAMTDRPGVAYEMCFSGTCDWPCTIPDAVLGEMVDDPSDPLTAMAKRWEASNAKEDETP